MTAATAHLRRPASAARGAARRAMRGAVAVVGVLWLMVAVICLMAIDVGHLAWQKRELQKMADLAALAGAGSESCVGLVEANASSNGFVAATDSFVDPDAPDAGPLADRSRMCGNWDPSIARGAGSPPQHFAPAIAPFNAARVAISRQVPYFFVFNWGADGRRITAVATAATRNTASFSLGTGVAALNDGVVNKLLNALLGTGNSIALDAVSYQGLANAHVRLLDLVDVAPQAGTVDQLLDTRLGLGSLLALTAEALTLGGANAVAVSALQQLVNVGLDTLEVTVGDLLKVTTANPEAAATAQVNVLELLMVAAQVANGGNLVNLQGGLNLPPLATVATKLVIVEPPSIAIGEGGRDANGNWKTQAHSATIRLQLDSSVLRTSDVPLVGALLGIDLLRLPIYIEVAPGDAWLSNIQCAATREDSRVLIGSQPGVARVCLSEVSEAQMRSTSVPPACNTAAKVSQVRVLFIPLVEVRAKADVQAVPMSPVEDMAFDGVIGNNDDIQRSTSNAVGSVVANAVSTLVDRLELQACILGLCGDASYLTDVLSLLTTHIITPLMTLLDGVIQPLLGLLGVQVGYSDVHHQSLSCGEPQLVY